MTCLRYIGIVVLVLCTRWKSNSLTRRSQHWQATETYILRCECCYVCQKFLNGMKCSPIIFLVSSDMADKEQVAVDCGIVPIATHFVWSFRTGPNTCSSSHRCWNSRSSGNIVSFCHQHLPTSFWWPSRRDMGEMIDQCLELFPYHVKDVVCENRCHKWLDNLCHVGVHVTWASGPAGRSLETSRPPFECFIFKEMNLKRSHPILFLKWRKKIFHFIFDRRNEKSISCAVIYIISVLKAPAGS